MVSRRRVIQTGLAAAFAASVPGQRFIRTAYGTPLAVGLSDPELQPKFVEPVPNALDPGFMFEPIGGNGPKAGTFNVYVKQTRHQTGLIDQRSGRRLSTSVWGYGYDGYEHTVNTHINRLRAKIEENPEKPKYIETVWGVGYRFAEQSAEDGG